MNRCLYCKQFQTGMHYAWKGAWVIVLISRADGWTFACHFMERELSSDNIFHSVKYL